MCKIRVDLRPLENSMAIKKWSLIFISFLLFSCGKGNVKPDNSGYNGKYITYNVPQKYYDKYKLELDAISADVLSKTGKQLVKFVSTNEDPKYGLMGEAYTRWVNTGEAWILFRDNIEQFTDTSNFAAGTAYTGTNINPMGVVVLNFTELVVREPYYFRQALEHEILHNLGFSHTFGIYNYSIMNYNYVYEITGMTDPDRQMLADKFPFSIEVITIKDLEKYGAINEKIESEQYAYQLVENFGLTEARAQTISRHLISYKKLNNQRALTDSEKERLSKEILGFGFEKGKLALEKYMQGEKESLDDLIKVAADKNETSPEHIKELFGEIFLK